MTSDEKRIQEINRKSLELYIKIQTNNNLISKSSLRLLKYELSKILCYLDE